MSEQTTVLVIEDEEHIRTVLKYNLELDGFEVLLAENASSGFELARQKTPDLVLLDWMMPQTDGLELLAQLRNDDKTGNIPVFMLTAKTMLRDVGRALYEGADDYITKPFDPTQLGEIIRGKLQKCVIVKKT